MTALPVDETSGTGDGSTPAPLIERADGVVMMINITGGSYRTYVMDYLVTNSATGEVLAQRSGLTLHAWLQEATPEEMAYVGAGVVQRVAEWDAGVR